MTSCACAPCRHEQQHAFESQALAVREALQAGWDTWLFKVSVHAHTAALALSTCNSSAPLGGCSAEVVLQRGIAAGLYTGAAAAVPLRLTEVTTTDTGLVGGATNATWLAAGRPPLMVSSCDGTTALPFEIAGGLDSLLPVVYSTGTLLPVTCAGANAVGSNSTSMSTQPGLDIRQGACAAELVREAVASPHLLALQPQPVAGATAAVNGSASGFGMTYTVAIAVSANVSTVDADLLDLAPYPWPAHVSASVAGRSYSYAPTPSSSTNLSATPACPSNSSDTSYLAQAPLSGDLYAFVLAQATPLVAVAPVLQRVLSGMHRVSIAHVWDVTELASPDIFGSTGASSGYLTASSALLESLLQSTTLALASEHAGNQAAPAVLAAAGSGAAVTADGIQSTRPAPNLAQRLLVTSPSGASFQTPPWWPGDRTATTAGHFSLVQVAGGQRLMAVLSVSQDGALSADQAQIALYVLSAMLVTASVWGIAATAALCTSRSQRLRLAQQDDRVAAVEATREMHERTVAMACHELVSWGSAGCDCDTLMTRGKCPAPFSCASVAFSQVHVLSCPAAS